MTLNVIKVLSVINFGPKRNKSPNSSRITIGPKLDESNPAIHSLHLCIEIYHFHIVHNNLLYSPLFVFFCIAIVSSFSWVLQVFQEKLKTRA